MKAGPRQSQVVADGNKEELHDETDDTRPISASKRTLETIKTYQLTPKSSKRVKKENRNISGDYVKSHQEQTETADFSQSSNQTGYRLIHIESLSNSISPERRRTEGVSYAAGAF